MPRCGDVSEAGGLREAIAAAAGQHPVNGRLKVHPVPDGNINGFCALLGPQRSADNLIAIKEWSIRARFQAQFPMLAAEDGLGTPNGRYIQDKPKMGGEAKPPRVGDALGISDEEVRGQG